MGLSFICNVVVSDIHFTFFTSVQNPVRLHFALSLASVRSNVHHCATNKVQRHVLLWARAKSSYNFLVQYINSVILVECVIATASLTSPRTCWSFWVLILWWVLYLRVRLAHRLSWLPTSGSLQLFWNERSIFGECKIAKGNRHSEKWHFWLTFNKWQLSDSDNFICEQWHLNN